MFDVFESTRLLAGAPLALLLSLVAAACAITGTLTAWWRQALARRFGHWLELLSGALLIVVVSAKFAPAAIGMGAPGVALMMLGATAAGIVHALGHNRSAATPRSARSYLVSILAISFHSYLDGGVYVSSIGHHHGAGAAMASGLILHEGAEGVLTFFLALAMTQKAGSAAVIAILAAGLTTPLGALSAIAAGEVWGPYFIEYSLPFAAGFAGAAGLALLWPLFRRSRAA